MKPALTRWPASLSLLLILSGSSLPAADPPPAAKPVLLYSRHFNAHGETRYLPDGTFKDILQRLRGAFEVRVHDEPLTLQTLAGIRLLLIANPSDRAVEGHPPPPHFSASDIATLTRFVEQGGGLILLGNQENHNLEVEDTNKLLARFGLQFTNLFTDAKKLVLPKDTPVIGGLRWAYYTGNLVALDAKHPAKPRALVQNDRAQKPVQGPRDTEGTLLAVAEPGRGRVAVVTDAGWLTDDALKEKGIGGVTITGQDNWEIFRRLAHWTAGREAK